MTSSFTPVFRLWFSLPHIMTKPSGHKSENTVLTFYYDALDSKRDLRVRGTWFAPTESKARYWLENQGYTDIRLWRGRTGQADLQVQPQALALFYRQLAVLLQSGTSLPFALKLVSHCEDPRLVGIARMLESQVSAGEYLSAGMQRFPKVFDPISVSLVRAGENSGALTRIMLDIARAKEREVELRSQLLAAMTYPAVLAASMLLVSGIFIFYVFPGDSDLFGSLGVQLPAINRAILSLVGLLRSPWVPGALLGLGTAAGWVIRKGGARKRIYRVLLGLVKRWKPSRELLLKIRAIRLLQILTMVVSNGGTVELSLKLMHDSSVDEVEQGEIESLRQAVIQGADFGQALEKAKIFPSVVAALLRVGFEAARLDQMSDSSLRLCEEDVRIGLDTLTSLVEPLLLGAAGLAAGFVIVTSALPLLKLIETL